MRAFNRERPRCTLSEIAAQIGLSRAVARRSLLTLQHLGYVAAQGRQFFLTPRVLELGYSYLSSLDLTDLAQEPMEKLSQRVGESCSMAVLDGSEIVYVARVRGPPPDECRARRRRSLAGIRRFDGARPVGGQIGQRTHRLVARKYLSPDYRAHDLQGHGRCKRKSCKVRRQGYAFVSQELELGLCSIAVPIRSATGQAVCGLNVSMRYSDDVKAVALKKMLPALQERASGD